MKASIMMMMISSIYSDLLATKGSKYGLVLVAFRIVDLAKWLRSQQISEVLDAGLGHGFCIR